MRQVLADWTTWSRARRAQAAVMLPPFGLGLFYLGLGAAIALSWIGLSGSWNHLEPLLAVLSSVPVWSGLVLAASLAVRSGWLAGIGGSAAYLALGASYRLWSEALGLRQVGWHDVRDVLAWPFVAFFSTTGLGA